MLRSVEGLGGEQSMAEEETSAKLRGKGNTGSYIVMPRERTLRCTKHTQARGETPLAHRLLGRGFTSQSSMGSGTAHGGCSVNVYLALLHSRCSVDARLAKENPKTKSALPFFRKIMKHKEVLAHLNTAKLESLMAFL